MKLEDQIAKLEVKKKELADKMYQEENSPEQLTDLGTQLEQLNKDLEEKTVAWMEIAELMEGE